MFSCCASFGTAASRAQDQQSQSVAEAARQERARKQQLRRHASHVYTGDDLKRAHILTPEDRAIVEAMRNDCVQKNVCASAPSENSQNSLDANSQPHQPSLGEIARQLRKQKELQALKPKQSEPFHLSIGAPVLASPILPERPAIRPPVEPPRQRKSSRSESPASIVRRDPFSAVPVSPEVRRQEIPRAEIRSRVPENFRSELHRNARASVREDIPRRSPLRGRGDVPPGATPEIRRGIFPASASNRHPDFAESVRPKIPVRHRNAVSEIPIISFPGPAPVGLLQPMQPSPPRSLAETRAAIAFSISTPLPASDPRAIPSQETVSVRRGDSLWKLALQSLGRGSRWPELLAINRAIRNPNQIRVGTQLYLPIPAPAGAARRLRISANQRTASRISVRKGDTLWSLAKSLLGRSSYWPCLAAANPAVADANLIFKGEELNIPAGCSPRPPEDSLK